MYLLEQLQKCSYQLITDCLTILFKLNDNLELTSRFFWSLSIFGNFHDALLIIYAVTVYNATIQ